MTLSLIVSLKNCEIERKKRKNEGKYIERNDFFLYKMHMRVDITIMQSIGFKPVVIVFAIIKIV